MSRLNLLKLRKTINISQRELAEKLNVQPSFLSAIENGRSRFPEDKLSKLKEIFDLNDLDDFYMEEDIESNSYVPPHTHPHTHPHEHESSREKELQQRIETLENRNDRLSQRVDDLRDEVDSLLRENLRLKELLSMHRIQY